MMHFARFAGFDHQTGAGAQALADQVMMHRRRRQQGRDRHALHRNRAVRQDENVVAGEHRFGRLAANAIERAAKPVGALGHRPGGVDRRGAERAADQGFDGADLFEIGVGQDRLGDFEAVMRAGVVAEQVGPRPDHRDQRHHQLFADRIDRRIRDLGEVLLEIIVEQLRLLREHGDRRVGAHRADRIVAVLRHRFEVELQVFLRVAEGLLAVEQRGGVVGQRRRRRIGRLRQGFELELRRLQPFLVRVFGGERALDFLVVDDAALLDVDQQHLAGLQPPLLDDALLRDRQHAHFRRHDDVIVVGDDVARRAQSVAVERGADLAPVGEGDRGRTVPRLHQRRVVFVKGAALRVHRGGCPTRPRGSASSWHGRANSRRRRGVRARCRCRPCRTARAGSAATSCRDRARSAPTTSNRGAHTSN